MAIKSFTIQAPGARGRLDSNPKYQDLLAECSINVLLLLAIFNKKNMHL